MHYVYGFCSVSCRLLLRNTGEVTHIAAHLKPDTVFWANNGVEMVTFWHQRSAAQAQAHAELSGRLRHTCREFCATMFCISFKVHNTVYREVRPTMYEFAKCCKFCLTLCSRTLKTELETMCWPAHARIGRLSYHLVSGNDIIHKPSILLYIGMSWKRGLELDCSRYEHKFKSMAYFVIMLIGNFEVIGFHFALSSTYGSFLQHLSAHKFYVSFLCTPNFRLTFFDRKNHLQRDTSTFNLKKMSVHYITC
jgi:hypothetical protein